MTYEKPDGEIEIGFSGCCCPPGQKRAGQHTNCSTRWWRAQWGGGFKLDWQPMESQSHTMTLAAAAENVAEFLGAMKADDAQPVAPGTTAHR